MKDTEVPEQKEPDGLIDMLTDGTAILTVTEVVADPVQVLASVTVTE